MCRVIWSFGNTGLFDFYFDSCAVVPFLINSCRASFHFNPLSCEEAINKLRASSSKVCREHMLHRRVRFIIRPVCWAALSMCVFGDVPADCREILLPLMTDQLKFHLEKREEPKACCQLLSDILEVLYRKDVVSNTTLKRSVLLFPSRAKQQQNKQIQDWLQNEEAHF